jgi:ATP-dependent exoDNAse (exonuclease V) beta subunit
MSENNIEIPRLSPSVAKHLLRAPSIAYHHHRLLGGVESEKTADMQDGNILERLITSHGVNEIVCVDAKDWRTKAAQELRSEVESNGGIAVLIDRYERYLSAAQSIRVKIERYLGPLELFQNQQRFEWQSDGVECSGVLDWLRISDRDYLIVDLKKTSSAHPKDIQRSIIKYGYDIQYAAYKDAVETAHPHLSGRGKFYFAFYEAQAPHCVTIAELDGAMRILGESKWQRAKRTWRECLDADYWPDYSDKIVRVEAKPYDLEDIEDTTDEQLDRMFDGEDDSNEL